MLRFDRNVKLAEKRLRSFTAAQRLYHIHRFEVELCTDKSKATVPRPEVEAEFNAMGTILEEVHNVRGALLKSGLSKSADSAPHRVAPAEAIGKHETTTLASESDGGEDDDAAVDLDEDAFDGELDEAPN